MPTPCPGDDALAAFMDGALEAAARDALVQHASVCNTCCSTLASVVSLSGSNGKDPLAGLPFPAATRIGRYAIVRTIGAGAMGTVYEAHDPELDRRVALKVLRGEGKEKAFASIQREAQAMARLSHPNVVVVHEAGMLDGHVYLAMELLEGGTLAGWLSAEPRRWREVLDRFLLAGRGLAAAHAAGIVHRDFKPDNVLLGEHGVVRVSDFGLAASGAASSGEPAILGTPAYMAPEQHAGRHPDARADVFSFSAALYTALCAQRPFEGGSVQELRAAIEAGRLRPPPKGRMPRWLFRAIERGLRANPEDRWPTMAAALAALAPPAKKPRWPWLAAGAAALAALVLWRDSRSAPPAFAQGTWAVLPLVDGNSARAMEAALAAHAVIEATPRVALEDPLRVARMQADLGLVAPHSLDGAGLSRAYAYLRVEHLLVLELSGSAVHAEVRDAVHGKVEWSRDDTTVQSATLALARAARWPDGGSAPPPELAPALDALARYRRAEARRLLEDAVARSPAEPRLQAELAELLRGLGETVRAKEHARAALSGAATLSPRAKRRVELLSAAVLGETDRAADLYRAAWAELPDDPVPAIALANLLAEKGRSKESLAIVAALRTRPRLAGDVRVDLLEAQLTETWRADSQQGQALAAATLSRAESLEDRGAAVAARLVMTASLLDQGRHGEAESVARLAAKQAAALGDGAREALADRLVGIAVAQQGDLAGAGAAFQRGAETARAAGDRLEERSSMANLAVVYRRTGRPREAAEVNARVLEYDRAVDDRYNLANTLNNRGTILLDLGDPRSARVSLGESLSIRRAGADKKGIANALDDLALVDFLLGDLPGAGSELQEALALWTEVGGTLVHTRLVLGQVRLAERSPRQAEAILDQAIVDATASKDASMLAVLRAGLALSLEAQGRHAEAGRALADAREALTKTSSKEARYGVALASLRFRLSRGEPRTALGKEASALSAEAEKAGDYRVALEARLVAALASGRAALEAVEAQARGRGYGLFAAEAAAARGRH